MNLQRSSNKMNEINFPFSLIAFHQVKINGSLEMPSSLIQRLNNGKPLTIYFDGILSHLKANGKSYILVIFGKIKLFITLTY